jgi:hypothetical protein
LFEQLGARAASVFQARLHQPGHIPDPLVTILGESSYRRHVHLWDARLPEWAANKDGIVVL